jgi:L-gulono-1,4-lactone dehydrogenase
MSKAPSTSAASEGFYVGGQTWRNWAGNIECTPAHAVAAATEEEVVAAVRFAMSNGLKLRVVGSGHSWTGLGETCGVQVNVGNIRHFRVSDRDRAAAHPSAAAVANSVLPDAL